jgi:hypothetical protein
MELSALDAGWVIDNNGALDALPGEISKLVAVMEILANRG